MAYGIWDDAVELERIHNVITGVVDSDITHDRY